MKTLKYILESIRIVGIVTIITEIGNLAGEELFRSTSVFMYKKIVPALFAAIAIIWYIIKGYKSGWIEKQKSKE